jgi:C4-type Zn-finger protein
MAGVAFYAVPHVGSQQIIEYICRQCGRNLRSKKLAKVKAIILENISSSISKAADLSNDVFHTVASCANIYYVFIEPNLLMILW